MMNLKTQKTKCKTKNKNTKDEMQGNVLENTEDEMLNKDLKEHKRLSLTGKKLTNEKATKPQNGSYKRKGTGTTLMRKKKENTRKLSNYPNVHRGSVKADPRLIYPMT